MASSSSSSSFTLKAKFDVFLSFRGEDTRDNFTSHLYVALRRKKIETFIDCDGLKRGDEISPVLLKAIEESKISIIVFSKDYASSRWCLDELTKILECKETKGQVVIPVFYHVNPSDIRKQTGNFEDAFVKHQQRFKEMTDNLKLQKWRTALTEAASIPGWDSSVTKPEAKLVDEIVRDILKKLKNMSSFSDSQGLVGLDSRIEQVKSLLCVGLLDSRVVGIWGMGGIGKTTIAGAIFNQISSQFEGCCFSINVREESEKLGGLVHLREQVLSQILEDKNLKIAAPNIPQFIQERLRRTKVLIVLDDVNELGQLEFLARGIDYFGSGSRIIITTRDKQVLYNYGVHHIYEVEGLNHEEALQLFCNYALKQNYPSKDFVELSNRIVSYAQGNPLALKVLGSALYQKSMDDWESSLRKLERVSNLKIYNVLKVSYDRLDREEKDIFLDIACFFKGADRDYVIKLLDDYYFSMHAGLNNLIDKALVTVFEDKLQMHDSIQEMGQEIVRQESIKKPGNRSRLWYHEDIYHVLKNDKGTDSIEGISLNMSKIRDIQLRSGAFMNMRNLRLLKFYNPDKLRIEVAGNSELQLSKVHVRRSLKYISNELRSLYWDGYPLKTIPSKFSLENLVELALPYSNIEQLQKGIKHASKLKSINLNNSPSLTRIHDLSNTPLLEIINLGDCKSLVDVPSSIQFLENLSHLSLYGCESLTSFPGNIHFRSLISLDLSGCINLRKFPQISGSIRELDLGGTAIEEVPSSIACLTELRTLDLSDCTRLKSLSTSICKLKSLSNLYLLNCLRLESFPEILEEMENLEELFLTEATTIRELPPSIEHFNGLQLLDLTGCKNLESIPSSICNLTSLNKIDLSGCSRLQKLPENLGNLRYLKDLTATGTALTHLPSSIAGWTAITYLGLSFCNLMEIPENICCLSSLVELHLKGNNFESLPRSIKQLSQPQRLFLSNCSILQSIPELPSRLTYVEAMNCKQLQLLPELPSGLEELDESKLELLSESCRPSPQFSNKFVFSNCLKLNQNAHSNILADSQLRIRIQHMATKSLRFWCEKVHEEIYAIGFYLPGCKIPDWFIYQSSGSSLTINLSQYWRNRSLIGFAICALIEFESGYYAHECYVSCDYQFENNYADRVKFECDLPSTSEDNVLIDSDHIVVGYVPCLDPWLLKNDCTTASFKFGLEQYLQTAPPVRGCKLKCCGVCPLYLLNITQSNILIERYGTTNGYVEDIVKFNDANASGNGRSDEEEMEPHPKRICTNKINVP